LTKLKEFKTFLTHYRVQQKYENICYDQYGVNSSPIMWTSNRWSCTTSV